MYSAASKPRLLFVDGPGGPAPSWYLPRLADEYQLQVLWTPSGNDPQDSERAALFGAHAHHVAMDGKTPVHVAILEQAKKWAPDGILALSERVVSGAHMAADKLGLPCTPANAADLLRSKYGQRLRMAQAGIATPRFRKIANFRQLQEAVEYVAAPAVLKPMVGVGSAAVFPVDATTNLAQLWGQAEKAYLTDPRGNRTTEFLLEERLLGQRWHTDSRYGEQVSVESIIQAGHIRHLAVTDKLPLAKHFRETADIMASSLPRDRLAELEATTTAAITALGLDNCAVHTEFKLTADGPRVIEVNGRIGGGVAQMLHYAADYDAVRSLASVSVGRPLSDENPTFSKCAAYLTPQPPADDAWVSRRPEPEDLLAIEGIVSAEVLCASGERTDWQRGTSALVAQIYAVADTPAELLQLNERLNSTEFFQYSAHDLTTMALSAAASR
ncbi:acetyl-CoA carboxylase biotin carboxylase subunit family protein [Streptomyces sp. BF23-18]|uniref:ATP-grasp domain-containing protein n=1 Tax=Streptomyces sp. BF23-18 TaxID=3240282 RepID=UPI0034E50D4C